MKTASLLSRERAEEIFERHKKALVKDGSLSPIMYINLQEHRKKPAVIPVVIAPPNDPLGKEIYYTALKSELQKKGGIVEALYIFEAWNVKAKVRPSTRPSLHPDRREVLGMMGRNADKSRVTMVEQCFSHSPSGGIEWEEMVVEKYNVPATRQGEYQILGVIDFLFPPVN